MSSSMHKWCHLLDHVHLILLKYSISQYSSKTHPIHKPKTHHIECHFININYNFVRKMCPNLQSVIFKIVTILGL